MSENGPIKRMCMGVRVAATWTYRVVAVVVTLLLLIANARLYGPGAAAYGPRSIGPDVLEQLKFIRGALDDGAGARMQELFPEGDYLTYVLYGWTWVEVAKRETCDAATRRRAIEEARWVLAHLESEEGLRPFDAAIDPPLGAFAIGYRAWLRGGLLMVTPDLERPQTEVEAFEKDCAAIALALRRSGPFICSYHNEAWPCDAVVGAAALRLHDRLYWRDGCGVGVTGEAASRCGDAAAQVGSGDAA